MKLSLKPETAPLTTDQSGVVRIGDSRVTLDTVVCAFNGGANAEEVLERYPSLHLGDIYAVIGYYLRHRTEIDTYLKGREAFAAEVRRQNESMFPKTGLRERLLARRRQ